MNRRRFIHLAAASVGGVLTSQLRGQALERGLHRGQWQGVLFGTAGSITLFADRKTDWNRLHCEVLATIRRLEQAVSLYAPDSELVRLNRTGRLTHPSADFSAVLAAARKIHADTRGYYDPTVQPLYALYRDHFARDPAWSTGPSPEVVAEVRARTGLSHLADDSDAVVFRRSGMALTFNGLAQGFATDAITALLRAAGFPHALVEMGETRALGPHPAGRPWQIALRDDPATVFPLEDRALATSSPTGQTFDRAGRFHHLLDPRTGSPVSSYASLSVLAPDATRADGYSTALAVMPPARALDWQRARPDVAVVAR